MLVKLFSKLVMFINSYHISLNPKRVWEHDIEIKQNWSGPFALITASVKFLAAMAKVIFVDRKLGTSLYFHGNFSFSTVSLTYYIRKKSCFTFGESNLL